MEVFKEAQVLAMATPLYASLIGIEIILSSLGKRELYSTKDTFANIYQTLLNMGLDIIMRGVCLWFLLSSQAFICQPPTNPILYWTALFFIQDFAFYVLHYVDHHSRLFWAVHFTHHSSEKFNLTTGFRSSVFQPLYRFVYFIPIAMLGFKGIDIMLMYAITQIYGILIHTQLIDKLGPLEFILATPSHHRVHHASNLRYIDKNLGMCLIIWDRLFGTFEAESEVEPVIYGLSHNDVNKNSATDLVFHEWVKLGKAVKKASGLKVKIDYIFRAPGWSHDGSSKTAKEMRKIK